MNSLIGYFEKIALVSLEKQDGLIRRLGQKNTPAAVGATK